MKWKYDKRFKIWWTCEGDYRIYKADKKYVLNKGYLSTIGRFRLFKNAKKVTELLAEG